MTPVLRAKSRSLRGRLRTVGADRLSDAELLAVVIGGRDVDPLARAQAILAHGGEPGLRKVIDIPQVELDRLTGEGGTERLLAAIELGRRASAQTIERGRQLRGAAEVYAIFGSRLRHVAQEEFHIILLDARHRVISTSLVTRGTADTSLVHAREVFRGAIREGASSVILVHNHPSGDPRPSPEDRTVTRQLRQAGSVVGIEILDHVIIGDGRWVSMAEEGGLDSAR
jgi:DNA repair protein RadC